MNGSSLNEPERLARIRVVLVEPAHPGNIGAAARALKTMGLSRLVLVRPARFPDRAASAMASNALDVLAGARVCDTLDEALAGTALSIALSARHRDLSHPALDARAAATELVAAAERNDVAVVFGNETAGLSNEDVMKCNRLARIPADPDYSSLNLAQAVQVVCYEVRMAVAGPAQEGGARTEHARHEDVEKFFEHLERSLHGSGFLDAGNPRRLMERLRRLFARARLEREEVNILRGMLTAWDEGRRPKK